MDRAHTKGRDRPILFSAPMVRALLSGTKTQTRRILPPHIVRYGDFEGPGLYHPTVIRKGEEEPGPETFGIWSKDGEWGSKLPIRPGDRLWVREGFATPALMSVQYRADPPVRHGHWNGEVGPWKSPIHMPRWASRLTLTVTDVRVQRLQEISEEDARAEGAELDEALLAGGLKATYRGGFSRIWAGIHEPHPSNPTAWGNNPWVAAYTFTVERRNIDEWLGQRADAAPSRSSSVEG